MYREEFIGLLLLLLIVGLVTRSQIAIWSSVLLLALMLVA